jgi:aspartyl-tRNA(Asn)/glutamyl-tRNA(Gln) amidotransferase subunit B
MVTELFGRLNTKEVAFSNSPVSPVQLASIVDLIESDRISGAIGKKVLDLMMAGDTRLAEAIVVEKEWELVTDPVLIDAAIHATIAEYPKQVWLAPRPLRCNCYAFRSCVELICV